MILRIKKKITKTKDSCNCGGFKPYSIYHILFMILFLISASVELGAQTTDKNTTDQIAKGMVSKIQTDIDPDYIYDYEHSCPYPR